MQQPYSKHLMFSVLLHIVLLSVFVVSFEFSSPMLVVNNSDKVIEAMVVQDIPSTKKIIQKPLPEPPAPPSTPPKKEVLPEPVKPTPVKEVAAPKKPDTIALPDKKQKKLKEDLLQKEFLADMEKIHKNEQKKLQQKSLQDEFAKEMKEIKAKAIQQQMMQDQKRVANAQQASQSKGIVDKYKALILQSIGQHWLVPANVDKKRSAVLLIRLAPGGVVLDVQLTKSSGDDALDRSARAAVFKSSPLPVPSEPDAFDPFRQFLLKVKPENILAGDSLMG